MGQKEGIKIRIETGIGKEGQRDPEIRIETLTAGRETGKETGRETRSTKEAGAGTHIHTYVHTYIHSFIHTFTCSYCEFISA